MARYKFDEIAINSTEKKKPVEEDKYAYLGLEHLDSGTLKVSRFGADVAPIGEKLIMRKGDVLFGKRRAYQKKVAIAPFDGIFSAHGMVLRPRTDVICHMLFPFFISSNHFLDEAIKISVGSLSPTINWRDLKDLEFNIPPIEKQEVLADELWAMEETKEAYNQLLIATDALVKSQFIEMFGDPVANPMGWKTKPFSDVAPESQYDGDFDEIVWLLNLDMVESNSGRLIEKLRIPIESVGNSTCTFSIDHVLYSKLRPYLNKVVVPDDKGYATTEMIPMKPNATILNRNFLAQLLRSDEFVTYATSLSAGTRMPRVPMTEFRNFKCILPPIEMQNRFVKVIEQVDKSKFDNMQCIISKQIYSSLVN